MACKQLFRPSVKAQFVSLDCPFLIIHSVFSNVYLCMSFQFHWNQEIGLCRFVHPLKSQISRGRCTREAVNKTLISSSSSSSHSNSREIIIYYSILVYPIFRHDIRCIVFKIVRISVNTLFLWLCILSQQHMMHIFIYFI